MYEIIAIVMIMASLLAVANMFRDSKSKNTKVHQG